MKTVRVALCQINPTVGDLKGNATKVLSFVEKASNLRPDIIVFPELAITGYPPEDLLLKPQFIEDNMTTLREIQQEIGDVVVILGFVDKRTDIYNAAAVIHKGAIIDVYHKIHLPNYGVFDELRYFQAGTRYPVYQMDNALFGVTICEDMWYPEGPATFQALEGAEFIININASPYHIGKYNFREKMLSSRASDSCAIVVYLNTVGGQDELVFDGHSLVIDQNGSVMATGREFEEDLIVVDLDLDAVFMQRLQNPRRRQQAISLKKESIEKISIHRQITKEQVKWAKPADIPFTTNVYRSPLVMEDEVYGALVLGTRDYIQKNGFHKVCIGLSGGIDSSLVAAIAADAVGNDNVVGLFMPSSFTSPESKEDAYELAENLSIKIIELSIAD